MDDVMGIDWDELRDRALAEWDDLTEEDLEVPEGDIGTLVERIQDRTGESADEIRTRLMGGEDSLLTEADDFDSL
ncbi:MAG TPA: hypothetical protein VK070_06190 [Acidimicrobiia bacterium]|nr:hypothetical protein [Acidimicrobiia bacterium]